MKIVYIILCFSCLTNSFALTCSKNGTDVIYVNGILGKEKNSNEVSAFFNKNFLEENKLDTNNTTFGFVLDVNANSWNSLGEDIGAGIMINWVRDTEQRLSLERVTRAHQWYDGVNGNKIYDFSVVIEE